MRKLTYILTLFILTSCGNHKTSKEQTSSDTIQKTGSDTSSFYKIISETENVNPKFDINKCNIEVELKGKISKEGLTSIAKKLRETRKSYDKLWIRYYLSDEKDNAIAWAMTNFTPDLEIEILGASDASEKKMNEVTVDGKIVGKWQDTRSMAECSLIIYEKEGKLFMKRTYYDGSSSNDEFVQKKSSGKIRFEQRKNTHNEYYILESNGNLGMYGNDGKFGEAIEKN